MPAKSKTKVHEFTLVLGGVKELTPDLADTLYQNFDDGTAGSCNGEVSIDFHRQAPSLPQAVQSALDDVRKAGLEVLRVVTEESLVVEKFNAGL
jgi:hypothetical protein